MLLQLLRVQSCIQDCLLEHLTLKPSMWCRQACGCFAHHAGRQSLTRALNRVRGEWVMLLCPVFDNSCHDFERTDLCSLFRLQYTVYSIHTFIVIVYTYYTYITILSLLSTFPRFLHVWFAWDAEQRLKGSQPQTRTSSKLASLYVGACRALWILHDPNRLCGRSPARVIPCGCLRTSSEHLIYKFNKVTMPYIIFTTVASCIC